MSTTGPTVLERATWEATARAHRERAEALTAGHRRRRSRGEQHPVEDFLFEYYTLRPGHLARWHAGLGVALRDAPDLVGRRFHRVLDSPAGSGAVTVDPAAFAAARGELLRMLAVLLDRTSRVPGSFGCFGWHEWAMVHGDAPGDADADRDPRRHRVLPLRLGQAGTDAVVRAADIRCSHFDAFRFFTPAAVPLNRLRPTPEGRAGMEQPGCLHVSMDLYRWAYQLGPLVPGSLLLACFELARDVRVLDMRASPYDVTSLGLTPVTVETTAGRAEYVAAQRAFASRAAPLRAALLDLVRATLTAAALPVPTAAPAVTPTPAGRSTAPV